MNKENWITLDDTAIDMIREAVENPITQGEMTLRASCARKWYYRYAMRLERRGFLDHNLVYGTLMHKLLEELYGGSNAWKYTASEYPVTIGDDVMWEPEEEYPLLSPKDKEDLELTRAKVQIAFNAYRAHWYLKDSKLQIHTVEATYKHEFKGIKLIGKIDMVAKPHGNDGVFIWDFKTAGQLDALSLDAWTFRFQFLFYCWLYWKQTGTKPIGTMINGLVKSALRPKMVNRKTKQMETQEEYLFRVKGEMMQDRDKYFYRQRIPLGTGALERFEEEILMPHLHAFWLLKFAKPDVTSALAMQMNTNQCHMYNSYCEYLSICKDGWMALSEFDKREHKHPEYGILAKTIS